MASRESIHRKGTVGVKSEAGTIGRIRIWGEETGSMSAVAWAGCAGLMVRAKMIGESRQAGSEKRRLQLA